VYKIAGLFFSGMLYTVIHKMVAVTFCDQFG